MGLAGETLAYRNQELTLYRNDRARRDRTRAHTDFSSLTARQA